MPTGTPNSTSEPDDLNVAEVARRLGKSENAVRKLCREGKLPGAHRENAGAPWQIPLSALDDHLRNNPPDSFWQRLRTTNLWQRFVAAIGVISFVLSIVNITTGFFSNLLGAAPVVEFAYRQALIAQMCLPISTATPLPIRPAIEGKP